MGWVMNYGVWRPVLLLLCVSLAWRPADASITQASYAPVALTSVTGLPPQLCRPELDLPARISGLAVSELPESVSGNTGAAASFTFYVSQGEHGRPVAGVTFSFRWIGPSLLPVTVAETGAGHYRAEFTALDPGDYQLEGWLMWENHQQAWGPVLEEPGELKAFFTDLRSEPRIRNQHKTSVHFAPDVSPMVGRWLSPVKGTNSDVFGHHDLRDSSAGLFVHDIRWMLNATFHRLVEASWRGTFIWKTLPAYSYRRDRYAATEFRTNEKIEWASGQILAFLKELTQAMELPFKVHLPLLELAEMGK
eukprot:jgi/Tetstr1/426974/TSEL_017187.t1